MRRHFPVRYLLGPAVPSRGFTLIEMIAVIVVTGAIFALGGIMLGRSFESYKLSREVSDVGWQGRIALERMARDLREIRSHTATDITTWSSSAIDFYNTAGNRVRFYQSGSQVLYSADGGATSQPLADNLKTPNGLFFDYYGSDGASAAAVTDIYYITVRLNIQNGGIDETYRMTIKPRRFE